MELFVLAQLGGAHLANPRLGRLAPPLGDPCGAGRLTAAQGQIQAIRGRHGGRQDKRLRRNGTTGRPRRSWWADGWSPHGGRSFVLRPLLFFLLLLFLLDDALQVLGDDPPPHALFLAPLPFPFAGESVVLPHLAQTFPPGGQQSAQGGLHGEGRAAGDAGDQDGERPREVEAHLEEIGEELAEGTAGRDRSLPPVDALQGELQETRRAGEQQRDAEPAADHPDARAPPQPPPARHQQEERKKKAGQAQEGERHRGDMSACGAGPVMGMHRLGHAMEEAGIARVVAPQAQEQEDRQKKEQQPGQLVPLLRGERRPFTRLARLGDRQGHGVLRLWMKKSGPSTHKE